MMKKQLLIAICLMLLCTGCAVAENAALPLEEAIHAREMQLAGAQTVQELIDGALSSQSVGGAEWYALALSQRGVYDFSRYAQALETYLLENTVRSQVTRQKYALTLKAVGGDEKLPAEILADSLGKQGIMSWVYGLHLMNNGVACAEGSMQQAIDKLLSMQLADGGWVITGKAADADVTAMTVQALSPHYAADERVRAAVDRAVLLLSDIQLDDGSYASYGKPNAESTAQVWTALSSLAIDALQDVRFIKNGHTVLDGLMLFVLPDNSFSHMVGSGSNQTATVQAYLAAAAYGEMLGGEDSLYLLGDAAHTAKAPKAALDYKTTGTAVILLLSFVGCVLLFVLKKRHIKNFAAVLLLAAGLTALLHGVDVQSPADYYAVTATAQKDAVGEVTLEIRCDILNGRADEKHIPKDGVILPETTFAIAEGDTVYDILVEAARKYALHMESSGAKGLKYVSGIANIYEYDHGDLSGWLYYINGTSLSEGCDSFVLHDGDQIEWLYTCAMGEDLN